MCRGTSVMVKLTFNFTQFYPLSYFHFWEKHSISVSVQLRRQNYCELWDKGFSIRIRTYTVVGGAGTVQL